MKRTFLSFGLVATLAFGMTFTMYSCGDSANADDNADKTEQKDEKEEEKEPVSEKGNWTDAEKERAMAEIASARADLEAFLGENTDTYVNCYLEKVMNEYANFDAANIDEPGCTKLATECMEEIMSDMDF